MSFAFIVMTMLLGTSMAMAFVLQPSEEQPAASANSHHRCQGGSLQAIRKSLLEALNLQAEPQLPAGAVDGVREQWRKTFHANAHRANDMEVPVTSGNSPGDGNSTSLTCCSMTSEIFMEDLGWDSWVIQPVSLSIVQCALCNPGVNTVQGPTSQPSIQDDDSQVPCCDPTSQGMVPVLYMDEFNTVVISSMQLTRSCGCRPGNLQQPSTE